MLPSPDRLAVGDHRSPVTPNRVWAQTALVLSKSLSLPLSKSKPCQLLFCWAALFLEVEDLSLCLFFVGKCFPGIDDFLSLFSFFNPIDRTPNLHCH